MEAGEILDDRVDGRRVYPEPPRHVRARHAFRRLSARLSPLMLPFFLLAWTRACVVAADWWVAGDYAPGATTLAMLRIAGTAGICLIPAAVLVWRPAAPRRARAIFLGAALWTAAPAVGDTAMWLASRSASTMASWGWTAAGVSTTASILATLGAVALAIGVQRCRHVRDDWFHGAAVRGFAIVVPLGAIGGVHWFVTPVQTGTVSGSGTFVASAMPAVAIPPQLHLSAVVAGAAAPVALLAYGLVAATALSACYLGEPQRRFWQWMAVGAQLFVVLGLLNVDAQMIGAGPATDSLADSGWGSVAAALLLAAGVVAMLIALASPVWSRDVDAAGDGVGAPDEIFVWGPTSRTIGLEPLPMQSVVALAAGTDHSLALDASGQIAAWGDNSLGQLDVPADLVAVGVAAGDGFSLALRADGTVAAWGANDRGQASPPPGLRDVKSIAAGRSFGLALKTDGTVVGWGDRSSEALPVPAGLSGVTAISAGQNHAVALRSDGSVLAWGDNSLGQTRVPSTIRSVKAISAGNDFNLALRADGTVVAWGDGSYGQLDVPDSLVNVVAIAAGAFHAVALMASGDVVGWGGGGQAYGESTHPWRLVDFKAIAAGEGFSLAVRAA